MKIKVIDILNTIARGEEPPKKIQYKGTTWEYIESEKDYSSKEWNEWLFEERIITDILNDYVEILEITIHNKENLRTSKRKIEKLENSYSLFEPNSKHSTRWTIEETILKDKINEIIDYIQE